MSDIVYTDLTVAVRRREDQGAYEFGVYLDGAFIVFGTRKFGGVEKQIGLAAEQATQDSPTTASE